MTDCNAIKKQQQQHIIKENSWTLHRALAQMSVLCAAGTAGRLVFLHFLCGTEVQVLLAALVLFVNGGCLYLPDLLIVLDYSSENYLATSQHKKKKKAEKTSAFIHKALGRAVYYILTITNTLFLTL